MRSLGWDLIQYDWCPYKKRKIEYTHTHTQGECHVNMKVATNKLKREASEETKSADTLPLDF